MNGKCNCFNWHQYQRLYFFIQPRWMFSKCSIVSYLRLVLCFYLGDLQPCKWAMDRCILMADQSLRTYSNPCGDEEVGALHQHSLVHCIPSRFSHEQGSPSAFIHSQNPDTEWFEQGFPLSIKIQLGQLVLCGLYQWDRDWDAFFGKSLLCNAWWLEGWLKCAVLRWENILGEVSCVRKQVKR